MNQERTEAGLKPLQVDMDLVRVAKTKSHDMAENNYFSHVSPNLGTVYNMLDREGIYYTRAGENIARAASVNRAHELFMNSSGHRANILHSGYTHIGVGIVKHGTSYRVTQVFIKLIGPLDEIDDGCLDEANSYRLRLLLTARCISARFELLEDERFSGQ